MKNIFIDYNSKEFSSRVYLGLLDESHALFLAQEMNEPEMRDYLFSNNFPISEKNEVEWIGRLYGPKNNQNVTLGIFLKDTKQLIGVMSLNKISYIHGTSITGAWLGKEFRNNGLGVEAKMLLLDYAFNTLNLRKIQSSVIATNTRSADYSKKCGYKVEATFPNQIFQKGKYWDEIFLAVYREDWLLLWQKFTKQV